MRFKDSNHSYCNEEGEVYQSATSLIKKFGKPFERDKKALKKAKERKITKEEVLAEWDKVRDEAAFKGTYYHKLKEDELNDKKIIKIDNEPHSVFCSRYHDDIKVRDSMELEPGVYTELLLWSDKYLIAGQADYVEITKGGKINIRDYKTSKKIDQKSWPRWDGSAQMLKFPLNHLEDCNFSTYSLQINLYAFLIKRQNRDLQIGEMFIDHIIGDFNEEEGFKLTEIISYEVPNLQYEIRTLLDYYVTQKNKL